MLSKRSIRQRFIIQLIFASASLIFIFSSILFFYIERSILDEKKQELLFYAKNIAQEKSIYGSLAPDITFGLDVEIIYLKQEHLDIELYETTKNFKT